MWKYEQRSGDLLDDTGSLVGVGYAGNGAAKNDPAQQCLKDHGPVPRGYYTILPPVHPQNHLGPLALPLEPDAANEMCHRGDFLIHGENPQTPGASSNGCIILAHEIRATINASNDKRLEVVA